MKKLLAIIFALGLLLSTGTLTTVFADADPDEYLEISEPLPRP